MLRQAGGDPNVLSPLGISPLSYACAFRLSVDLEGGDFREKQQVTWAPPVRVKAIFAASP